LEVGIEMKTAFTTEKVRLRPAVASVGKATLVASLRGVSRVYGNHLAADSLSLVFEEALESGEAPRVESALGFSARGFAPSSDVGEVFHNDGCSWLNAMEDRSGNNVVTILPESKFSTSEASKMPTGRLSTFGLQSTFETQIPLGDFCHMPVAVKAVIGGNSRTGNSKVNADSFTVGIEADIGHTNYNMKVKHISLPDEISGSRRAISSILCVLRKLKGYPQPTVCGRHAYNTLTPVYFGGVQIISGWNIFRLRTGYLMSLLYQHVRRLQRLRGLSYCLYVEVRYKLWESVLVGTVNKTMQIEGVSLALFPTDTTNAIKRLGKLANGFPQSTKLLWGSQESNFDGSIHTEIIPHCSEILQLFRREACCDLSVI